MKKIKVPAKTVQNFETVFDNLHSAIAFNILRREDRTYKNYGLLFLDKNGTPTSTDWQVELLTPYTGTKFRTRVGTSGKALGLLSSGEIVGISADKDVNLSTYQQNKYYLVYVVWDSVGTEPIPTADGFMYNPDGSVNTQNTVYLDRTTITVVEKTTLSSALSTANEYVNEYTDRLPLAILKTETSSVEWDVGDDWGNGTYEPSNGVIDLRGLGQLQLNDYLLDDSQVVMKDRNSTIADGGAIVGDVEVNGTFAVTSASPTPEIAITNSITSEVLTLSEEGISHDSVTLNQPLSFTSVDGPIKLDSKGYDNGIVIDGDNVGINGEPSISSSISLQVYGGGLYVHEDMLWVNDFAKFDTDEQKAVIGSEDLNDDYKIYLDGTVGISGDVTTSGYLTTGNDILLPVDGGIKFGSWSEGPSMFSNTTGTTLSFYIQGGFASAHIVNSGILLQSNGHLILDGGEIVDDDGKILLQTRENTQESLTEIVIGDADNSTHTNLAGTSTGINTRAHLMSGMNFAVTGDSRFDDIYISRRKSIKWDQATNNQAALAYPKSAGGDFLLSLNLDYDSTGFTGVANSDKEALAISLTNITHSGSAINFYVTDPANGEDFVPSRDKRASITNDRMTLTGDLYVGDYYIKPSTGESRLGTVTFDEIIQTDGGATFESISTLTAEVTRTLTLPGEGSYISESGYMNFSYADYYLPSGTMNVGFEGTNPALVFWQKEYNAPTSIEFKNFNRLTDWLITKTGDVDDKLNIYHRVGGELSRAVSIYNDSGTHALSTQKLSCNTLSLSEIEVTSSGLEFDKVFASQLVSTENAFTLNSTGVIADRIASTNGMFAADYAASSIRLGTEGHNAAVVVEGSLTLTGALTVNPGSTATIAGVTNEEFLVGVGSLGVSGEGVPVMLDYNTPTVPNNLRIYDMVPVPGNPGVIRPFYTVIKWGFESLTADVYGDAANNQVYIGLDDLGLDEDEILLSGALTNRYYTSSDSNFGQYLIDSVSISGQYAILTLDSNWSENKVGASTIKIIEDANFMEFEVSEWAPNIDDPSGEYILVNVQNKTLASDTNVGTIQTFPDNKYQVRARTKKASAYSNWAQMPAGTYDPDHVEGGQATVSYGDPFLAQLPYLTNDGATITTAATDFGFTANAGDSWKGHADTEQNCHQYHFAYTTSTSGLNFDDTSATHSHVYQASPFLSVATTESNTYTVGVRPMQNGMAVGTGLTSTVTSGGGGNPPPGQVIAERDFDIISSQGEVTAVSGLYYTVTLSHEEHDPVFGFFKNQVITENSYNYMITKDDPDLDNYADGTVRYIRTTDSENGGSGLELSDSITIGQSKRARRIISKALTKDTKITSVSVSVNSLHTDEDHSIDLAANPVVIRVYQAGNENAADSLTVSAEFVDIVQTMNVQILSSVGSSRTLVVDAYDPNNNNNVTSISASISVHGEAITNPDDVPVGQ